MFKHFITISFISITVLVACHKKNISNSTSESKTEKQTVKIEIKNAIVDPQVDLASKGAAYTIDSISIAGDILSVFVNYSGGCKEHSFDLYSNKMYGKSLPPQLSLCLKHAGADDACRELIMKELKFNVSNLKYPGKTTLILKIGDKRATYTYQ
jgi:hypothetical protein